MPARKWVFICPSCQTEQSGQDLLDVGVSLDECAGVIGYSCIGRFTRSKGCDWTLGGLFQIHTLEVVDEDGGIHPRFEFADEKPDAVVVLNPCIKCGSPLPPGAIATVCCDECGAAFTPAARL